MKTTEKMQTTKKMKMTPKTEICTNVPEKMLMTPCLDCHSTTDLTPEIEFDVIEEMYVASHAFVCLQKRQNILGKDD